MSATWSPTVDPRSKELDGLVESEMELCGNAKGKQSFGGAISHLTRTTYLQRYRFDRARVSYSQYANTLVKFRVSPRGVDRWFLNAGKLAPPQLLSVRG